MTLKQLVFIAAMIVSINHVYASGHSPIYIRHYTVTRPYFVSAVEPDTDNPNFSVFKISGQTFDAHNDYNEKKYYTAVKLWASNGKSKSYVHFSDSQRGPQVIQCAGCPVFEKVDNSNYRIKF